MSTCYFPANLNPAKYEKKKKKSKIEKINKS